MECDPHCLARVRGAALPLGLEGEHPLPKRERTLSQMREVENGFTRGRTSPPFLKDEKCEFDLGRTGTPGASG